MTSYMVRLDGHGIDFVVKDRLASVLGFFGLGRSLRCTGFFATRYVLSDTSDTAIQIARLAVTEELLKRKLVSMNDLARLDLRVDEVVAVSSSGSRRPSSGFSFYQS
jgi:hypothetical protein